MRMDVLLIVAALWLTVGRPADAAEQIHLSLGSDPSQMVVTWVTQGSPPIESVVEFGIVNEILKESAYGNWTAFNPGGDRVIFIHRVILNDLKQDVTYEYAVKDGKRWSETFSFRTSAGKANPVLAVFGDFGYENAKALPNLVSGAAGGTFDAMFHIGDLAYDMQDEEGRIADDFMNMIQPVAANVPYQILPGNHEQYRNFSHYDNLFTMMDVTSGIRNNFYYSTNIGPLHVVSITDDFYFFTNYGTGQIVSQYNWLVNDLKEANKPENRRIRPWIIVLSHRPMYCSASVEYFLTELETVRNGIDGKYGLEHVMHDHKVDVFFAGHIHLYERTLPLYQGKLQVDKPDPYLDPEYPVHVVTGAAGCKHHLLSFLSFKPDYSAKRISDYSYTTVNASSSKLVIQQIAAQNGKVMDSFEIKKSSK